MERNYVGQGNHSGGTPNTMISSGRRAGMVRPPSGDDGVSPNGSDASQGLHAPRFGRRASPGSTPTGGGMEMDPPKYAPPSRPSGGTIPRGATGGASASSAAATAGSGGAAAAGAAAAGGGGMSSKLAGLQRLKDASTARLVSRIPSASGRSTGDTGSYVPSAMTNPAPARGAPARTNSNGRSGSGGSAAGYGNSAAPSSSAARSASSGPAMAAAGRPPSGRSTGSGAPAGGSSGYGASGARQPSYGGASSSSTAAAAGGGYGRGPASSGGGGGMDYGGSGGGSRQPPPPAARRAPAPAAAAPPPPQARKQPVARAPPPAAPPPVSNHYQHNDDDMGYGGGGGGAFGGGGGAFGGGGGFGAGSIPPGAEEDAPVGPKVECPSCGRNFNEQAYAKHAKICEKVFATKRKPVNMAAKRLEGSEAVKYFDLRKGVPKSEIKAGAAAGGPGRGARGGAAAIDDRPLPGSKVPKWKSQSEQLRAAMSTNRRIADAKANGVDIRDLKFEATPASQDDRVPCPHCGRKFAEMTAERHIPKCKDTMAKPGRLAAGGGRGAHMRR